MVNQLPSPPLKPCTMQLWREDEVILVPTGSYTNIALLFKQYPEVKSHIKEIVAMGGSISGGNMTSIAEFNVFTDPRRGGNYVQVRGSQS